MRGLLFTFLKAYSCKEAISSGGRETVLIRRKGAEPPLATGRIKIELMTELNEQDIPLLP